MKIKIHLRIIKINVVRDGYRKWSNPSDLMESAQRDTCEESMACMVMPASVHSRLASTTSSRIASMTFLKREPWTNLASNILN